MPELCPDSYKFWPRPLTEQQLGEAVVQATLAHAASGETFTTRDLFVQLHDEHLLPPTQDFAHYFRGVIRPAVVAYVEVQGGLAEWQESPADIGNNYSLILFQPEEETPTNTPTEDIAEAADPQANAENPDELNLNIAGLILDAIKDHKHPDQYINQSALLAMLKEQYGIKAEQARSTIGHLEQYGMLDVFKKSSRKHGGPFIAVAWSDPKISRTWRLHQETIIKYLKNPHDAASTFTPTPLNRRERRSRQGRTAKDGRSRQR